jgi:hypothetical protein
MKVKAYAIRNNRIVCQLGIPPEVTPDNRHEWVLDIMRTMRYENIVFMTEDDFKRLFW